MAIIATAQVDINETPVKLQKATDATNKTIQDTSKLTSDQFSSAMNGRVTQSQYDPTAVGDDGNTHVDGDMWVTVDTSGHATKMWIYNNNAWAEKTWSQETLSVKELSALSADLGEIQTGTLLGVNLYAKQLVLDLNADMGSYDAGLNPKSWDGRALNDDSSDITDQNLTGLGLNFGHGLLHIKGRRTDGYYADRYDSTYIGPNDIKIREQAGTDIHSDAYSRLDLTDGGITGGTNFYTNRFEISNIGKAYFETGISTLGEVASQTVTTTYLNMQNQTINSVGGAFHFEQGSGGSDNYYAEVYGGKFTTKGTNVKSTLSSKRNIEDFSTTEALSEINNATIKRWQYIEDDNSENHIGPIIDDVNELGEKKYALSPDMVNGTSVGSAFNQSNAISVLMGAVQELSKRNDELSLKVYQLEGKLNNVN